MNAEIISIGDELLIGQVVNTNAAWIGRELGALGVPVTRVNTIGDNAKEIIVTSRRAWKEADVVIATGGLGPTHDDISKAAVATFFKKKLKLHKPTLEAVKARFAKLGYDKMPESNISQAMVPEGFQVLKNDRGTAPGLLFYNAGKTYIILPGVPQEMEFLMTGSVLPFLKHKYKNKLEAIKHRTIITAGIGESSLAEKIGDPKTFLKKSTILAFLPRAEGVRLRITSHGKSTATVNKEIDRVEAIIRERAGKYVLGTEDQTLAATVVRLLTERSKVLATAESCTGGLIASKITETDGASTVFYGSIVAYHNHVKIKELGVRQLTLIEHGAVSEETAIEMAEGALEKLGSDFAIAVTGIAGPDGGTKEKPVGTIWIALAERNAPTLTKKLQQDFGRVGNRERAAAAALEMLRRRLLGNDAA